MRTLSQFRLGNMRKPSLDLSGLVKKAGLNVLPPMKATYHNNQEKGDGTYLYLDDLITLLHMIYLVGSLAALVQRGSISYGDH